MNVIIKPYQLLIFWKKKKKNPWKKVVELSVYKYRLVGNTTNILMKGGIPNKQMKENLKVEIPYHNCCIFIYLFIFGDIEKSIQYNNALIMTGS